MTVLYGKPRHMRHGTFPTLPPCTDLRAACSHDLVTVCSLVPAGGAPCAAGACSRTVAQPSTWGTEIFCGGIW